MLQAEHLSAAREELEILRDIDIEIRPGANMLLMGPNGSGKTSLARVLLGDPSYRATEGSIRIVDEKETDDMTGLLPHERARKGLFVSFQSPVELPGVTTHEFLFSAYKSVYPEEGRDLDVDEMEGMIETAAEKLGIADGMLMRGVNEGFSGGERKKLELLQMVILQPKYVVLDEPDSGLDADSVKLISVALSLLEKHPGVLVISHDAKRLGGVQFDAVSIMRDGTISENGGVELIERVSREGYD